MGFFGRYLPKNKPKLMLGQRRGAYVKFDTSDMLLLLFVLSPFKFNLIYILFFLSAIN